MWFLSQVKFTGIHQCGSAMEREVRKKKDTSVSSPSKTSGPFSKLSDSATIAIGILKPFTSFGTVWLF